MSGALAVQRSFDDLGTPLIEQTFVVFDLETTGGSPQTAQITEIGAVKIRAGDVVGEFQTLVDPGVPIPPMISALTGITDVMVAAWPPIEAVLPSFLEFTGDAALVAHNASFDTGFLRAVCARLGYPIPGNPVVCTVRLARRLVRDEVPNLRLETLARAMRARTMPTHRALDDARATADVFHALLELAGRWGVHHTDELIWFCSARGHPSYRKVSLTESLPRARGVYLFRNDEGRVLYVGKATDLRARVRSYFGDERRRIDDLLREMESIDHVVCATDLEASVLEARLIRAHSPAYNRAQRGRATQWFLRLTDERFPRLSSTRTAGAGLGPMPSGMSAAVREALEEATNVRTCTMTITRKTAHPPCVRGQIGRCPAPCAGSADPAGYDPIVATLRRALEGDPTDVLALLGARIDDLAADERFELAVATRDRIASFVDALRTAREVRALVAAGRLDVRLADATVEIDRGTVATANGLPLPVAADDHPDEPRLIAAWLARNRTRARIASCDGTYAQPVGGGRALTEWHERFRRLRADRMAAR